MMSVLLYILFGFILRKNNIITGSTIKIMGVLNFMILLPLFSFTKIPS